MASPRLQRGPVSRHTGRSAVSCRLLGLFAGLFPPSTSPNIINCLFPPPASECAASAMMCSQSHSRRGAIYCRPLWPERVYWQCPLLPHCPLALALPRHGTSAVAAMPLEQTPMPALPCTSSSPLCSKLTQRQPARDTEALLSATRTRSFHWANCTLCGCESALKRAGNFSGNQAHLTLNQTRLNLEGHAPQAPFSPMIPSMRWLRSK